MGIKHFSLTLITGVFVFGALSDAHATSPPVACPIEDKACIFSALKNKAEQIENKSWRDQTYRELAKSLSAAGFTDQALEIIPKIETPDTKALTIRGIGMSAAALDLSQESHNALFTALRAEAEKITHPQSYAIALTYIAMAQAFAGDNEGAWKTASEMENDALRHKAYGETAEIQAEQGDPEAAMRSIHLIESPAFRNKAYSIVSKILTDKGQYQEAMFSAVLITNPYKHAKALQYIVNQKRAAEQKANEEITLIKRFK